MAKKKKPSPDDLTAPLTTIIEKIQNSLQEANNGNATDIVLDSITASFVLSQTSSKGMQLRIWLFKIGGVVENSRVHTVIFELERPQKSRPMSKKAGSEDLTQFIKNVLADFKSLNASGYLKDLSTRGVTIEVGLTISRSGNVGGEYTIGIFTLSAEAGRKSEQGHTLKLVFKKEKVGP